MPQGVQTEQPKQTFVQHLSELRRRLLIPVLFLGLASIAGFVFSAEIVALLQKPLNKTLYYSSPVGGFSFIFQIAIFAGLLVTLPVFMHQIVKFIEPVMSSLAKRTMVAFMATSIGLAAAGVLCGYLISLPAALHFLSSFESDKVQALISADQYLKFVMTYLAGYAILFQMPLVVLIINRIKPLTPGGMMRYQRHVIVASFIVAAILTPTPDAYNQVIFALPLLILYQISIASVWLANRRTRSAKMIAVAGPVAVGNYEVKNLEAIPLNLETVESATSQLAVEEQPVIVGAAGFDIIRPQAA